MRIFPPNNLQQRSPQSAPPEGDGLPNIKASQAVVMLKLAYRKLGEIIEFAGPKMNPADIKLFEAGKQATDLFINALTQKPMPSKTRSGPMPMNANAKASPAAQY